MKCTIKNLYLLSGLNITHIVPYDRKNPYRVGLETVSDCDKKYNFLFIARNKDGSDSKAYDFSAIIWQDKCPSIRKCIVLLI